MDNTPLAMSFEEIKAQAEANMKADKGQGNAAAQQGQAQQSSGTGKSFLDMVEEAEHQIATEVS